MKKKIAIIDPLGAHGSSFHMYTFGQALGLENCGIDVRIYTNDKTLNNNFTQLKVFNFYKNMFNSRFKFINGLRWVIGSFRSIFHAKLSGYSIFHFHIFHINLLILYNVLLTKFLFGKVVLTIHDVHSFNGTRDSHFLCQLVYKLADLHITHNKFSKNEIIKSYSNLEISKIHIIPHGNFLPFIDIKKKSYAKNILGLPKNKKILLFFGMIKEVKGLDVLLKGFRNVVSENPDTILLIAGRVWQDSFEKYQLLINKYNLTQNIILHTKFIQQDKVDYYFSSCDLVILPYKKIYQSGVLLMSLSYEKPVLVSDLLPFTEIIKNNENGFIFKSESSSDLYEKINSILNNKELINKVQENSSEMIKAKYSWDEIGRLSKIAYQDL